jgi:hypothetical protein
MSNHWPGDSHASTTFAVTLTDPVSAAPTIPALQSENGPSSSLQGPQSIPTTNQGLASPLVGPARTLTSGEKATPVFYPATVLALGIAVAVAVLALYRLRQLHGLRNLAVPPKHRTDSALRSRGESPIRKLSTGVPSPVKASADVRPGAAASLKLEQATKASGLSGNSRILMPGSYEGVVHSYIGLVGIVKVAGLLVPVRSNPGPANLQPGAITQLTISEVPNEPLT